MYRCAISVPAILVAALFAAGTARAWIPIEEEVEHAELVVELRDALWSQSSPDQRKPLTLKLVWDGGEWEPFVMGHSRAYNHGDHYGSEGCG